MKDWLTHGNKCCRNFRQHVSENSRNGCFREVLHPAAVQVDRVTKM